MTKKYTRRYLLAGIFFGLLFPVFASVIELYYQQQPLSLTNLIQIQGKNPLQWVIYTAPFFLGLFAALAGRRQDRIAAIYEELEDKFIERQQMVAKLVALQNNLERQVESRTADLNLRKNQFEAVAKVARATAGIRELDPLLDQAAELISQTFDFYHTGIFLLDERNEYAVLKAASSPGGKRMIAHGHRLEIGEKGIVGHVAGTGEPRISLDAGADAVYFDNPELPETRSELAIPLLIRDVVIGVLDVQSKIAGAFSDEDLKALQLLGDQLALAIETSHLIEEKQAALQELERAHLQFSQHSWSRSTVTQADIAFRCDARGRILPLDGQGLSDLIVETTSDIPGEKEGGSLILPLKIREQTVGEMRFNRRLEAGSWTEDEISLLQTLTDQVSVAMDSARLYMDSRRQAERERLVADITTKIRKSNDPRQILQTAVHELQTALRAQRAQFKFQSMNSSQETAEGSNPTLDEGQSNGSPPEGAA